MISTSEAYEIVMANLMTRERIENVDLLDSIGRILAEDITADRDFPPFDRVCMDGIAICFNRFGNGQRLFQIESIAAAGEDQQLLLDKEKCIEIMTGAVLPKFCDAVIPYEHLSKKNDAYFINENVKRSQNIHIKGRDIQKAEIVLSKGIQIKAIDISVLATVGRTSVSVFLNPKVAVISSGDELVKLNEIPKSYQIRRSNVHMLRSRLNQWGIASEDFHAADDPKIIRDRLERVIEKFDVIMLSGGVSKGKFDFIPKILEDLSVKKLFHRVAQKPGKPMWFGRLGNCFVFAFPGNPVSTLACLHKYFYPWYIASTRGEWRKIFVKSNENIASKKDLTRFALVKCIQKGSTVYCQEVKSNGSGDMINPAQADGFVEIPKSEHPLPKGTDVVFMPFHPDYV